jgi:serine/threonine protein kinase
MQVKCSMSLAVCSRGGFWSGSAGVLSGWGVNACAAGDLKGGNVLLKSTSTFDDPRGFLCKIGDFGLSRVLEADNAHVTTNTYGTPLKPMHALLIAQLITHTSLHVVACMLRAKNSSGSAAVSAGRQMHGRY